MLNEHPFFRKVCVALQDPLRWEIIKTQNEECPMALYAVAYGIFGLLLGGLAVFMQWPVSSRLAGAAVAALLISLLRGYVSGWRQVNVPFRLAQLLTAYTPDTSIGNLRAQCLSNLFVLMRPFLFFCILAAGAPFWLGAALALTCAGANDLVENMEPRQNVPCSPEWITAAALTLLAALLNRGSWHTNLATGIFVSAIAWMLPLVLCRWNLFAESRKMTEFVFECIILTLFSIALLF